MALRCGLQEMAHKKVYIINIIIIIIIIISIIIIIRDDTLSKAK